MSYLVISTEMNQKQILKKTQLREEIEGWILDKQPK